MKTLDYILENYEEFAVSIMDRLGTRLCQFLTEEQGHKLGFEVGEGKTWPEPIPFTRENVLAQLEKDVEFGFEKALDKRGISSSLMFEVVRSWNKILEEGLENWSEDEYAMYGLPLFKATAVKYGWDNPIGDDTGTESYYEEDFDDFSLYGDE